MRIALVQMSMEESPETNLDEALAAMRKAASNGTGLVCFPEIQFSPFFQQVNPLIG